MRLTVNGEPTEVAAEATVGELLERLDLPHRGIAVAVDREVVPRGAWDSTALTEGARVEVVHAVQGG